MLMSVTVRLNVVSEAAVYCDQLESSKP